MNELHASRAGAAGLDQLQGGFYQIRDIAFGLWDAANGPRKAPSDKSAKKTEAQKAAVAASLPEIALDNHWSTSGKGSKGRDRLTQRVTLTLSAEEFKNQNPGFDGRANSSSGASFNVRHASTGEIDSGWKVDAQGSDGILRLSKQYSIDVSAKTSHDGLLESTPDVPKEHIKGLEAKLSELPPNIRKALSDKGYKILAASTNTDAIPELKGLIPRGWPADTTFDNSDGTHDNLRRLILAPVRFKSGADFVPVDRDNVVVHQIGHALDHAFGKLSNAPEFQKAFKAEMEKLAQKGPFMNEREKAIYNYFNQKDGPGKDERPGSEEAFASLFGLVLTGPENEEDRQPFENNFAETIKIVRQQIKAL